MSRRRQILFDCLLLFFSTTVLVRPYFLDKYTDQWPSIESTFIADARFLAAHWPHPRWQPLWYGGTRFDYIYPPALRYGTAILSKVTGWWPVKAYHFYTMCFYCVGIAGVYLLMRTAGRKRGFAFVGAAAFALVSPCLLLLKDMRADSQHLTPIRLTVLLRYGEGPHMSALALVPFALAFAWLALARQRLRWVALSAVLCAAVVSNNFYGATALAIFYPLMLWSFWVTRGGRGMLLPAIAIPALAYGLTAFWLTPSYLSVTTGNLRYLPHNPATWWSYWLTIVLVTTYVCVSRKLAQGRPERTWAVFVIGLMLFLSLDVLGDQFFQFSVVGDPHRLIPELDLALILCSALLLEWLWNRRGIALKVAVCVVVAVALITSKGYVRRAWLIVGRAPDYTSRVEYRITDWIWKNMPDARVCSGGSVRFWFDAWHDLDEMGGGSEQGLLNPVVEDVQWELSQGSELPPALLWLRAFGVDAMYFAGPKSEEPYHDYARQGRFASLPVLYDDGQDNRIYAISRRYPARARVVDTARMRAQKAASLDDIPGLAGYVDLIENGPDSPATLTRQGTDGMLVRAQIGPGQSLLVQETWDPSWRASAAGQPLAIRKDPAGFMVMDPPPGDQTVRLEFVMPLENRLGWGLTALTLVALAGLVVRRER